MARPASSDGVSNNGLTCSQRPHDVDSPSTATPFRSQCPESLNDRSRRISPVAAHSGDRLLSEPTAGTQPCRREPLFMPHSGPSGSPTWRLSWARNWPWEYTKAQGLRCARMSRSNRSRSSIWTYEWHSNIDARVCWGHLMLVTADRGVGLKCDYQRDALATGIVRGR